MPADEAGRRHLRGRQATSLTPRSSGSAPTSTAWSTRRWRPPATAACSSASALRRPAVDVDIEISRDHLLRAGRGRVHRRPRGRGHQPRRPDASIEPTPTELVPDPRRGRDRAARGAADELSQARWRARRGAPSQRQVDGSAPEVTTDELAAQYPTYLTVDRRASRCALRKTSKRPRPTRSRSVAGGFDTPTGPAHDPEQAGRPDLERPRPRAGPATWPAHRSRRAREPAEGALDGDLRRRRHPRHRRHGSLGSAASHGCVRMVVPDVIELLRPVDVGTPIYIQASPVPSCAAGVQVRCRLAKSDPVPVPRPGLPTRAGARAPPGAAALELATSAS